MIFDILNIIKSNKENGTEHVSSSSDINTDPVLVKLGNRINGGLDSLVAAPPRLINEHRRVVAAKPHRSISTAAHGHGNHYQAYEENKLRHFSLSLQLPMGKE